MTPVSKFEQAVSLDSGTEKEEFDETLAEPPVLSLPLPVPPSSPRQQPPSACSPPLQLMPRFELFLGLVFVFEGSIAGVTVWVFFSVGPACSVLVNMSDGGFRVLHGALALQKYIGNSFLEIFA